MADHEEIDDSSDQGEGSPVFLLDHTDPAGAPRPDVWRQAIADFYQLDLDAGVLWSQIGPAPLIVDREQIYMGVGPDAGEVTDILIDPSLTTDKTLYVTTNDGGIWKTSDAGQHWSQMTDQMFSLSMGAVAMDPADPDTIYGGSGNLFDGGVAFTKGAGIYKSIDGGLTWSIVDGGFFGTIFADVGISRIVCPVANCLLVATNQGLYRSADGGRNFGANAPTFNDRKPVMPGRICCLQLDTASPATTVYCGVAGDSVDANKVPLANRGLFRSTDAGVTFPANLFGDPTAPQLPYRSFVISQSQFDRITANSATFYASVQTNLADGTPTFVGLYRSTNSGATWTLLPNLFSVARFDGFKQTYYDLTLGVDPLDSRRVYAGFQQVWLSTDGGANFNAVAVTQSQVHWDNHSLVFSPASHRPAVPAAPNPIPPTAIYTGTDGGIAVSIDGGLNWKAINGAMATNLFRGIDIGKGATDSGKGVPNQFTYGGCQDTGTSGHRPTDSSGEWHAGINGDGRLVAVDPSDPTIVYGFDNQSLIKSTDKGATWAVSPVVAPAFAVGLTNAPPSYQRAIALDQNGAAPATRIVYVSEGKVLYKSIDGGAHFTATGLSPANYITCIVTSSAAAGLVWAGCADGSVHCSLDFGANWDVSPLVTTPGGEGVPMGPVNHIAIDPKAAKRIAVVYGGFAGVHSKFRTRHIFLSLDNGATWSDVSGTDGNGPKGNLPDLPLRSVVFDTSAVPSAIVAAGDVGVLRSIDATITGTGDSAVGSATWKIYGAGLPMVCCNSLAIDNSVSPPILRVGTYGRSCFEATHPTGPIFASDDNLGFGTVATGQTVTLPIYVYSCGDAPLVISAASVLAAAPFTLGAAPALPVSISSGATQAFQVTFAPTAPGDAIALVQFSTNDPGQTNVLIGASGSGVNTALAPRLASNPIAKVGFGSVIVGAERDIPVQLFNVGTAALNISGISASNTNTNCTSSDFSLNPAPAFPIAIPPGGESDVTFKFGPSGGGLICAVFAVASDDPQGPLLLTAYGNGDVGDASIWIKILVFLGLGKLVSA